MKTIAINDIKKPWRVTVKTRNEFVQVLNGAHVLKDAIEIYFDGIESIYYICPMDQFNEKLRKMVLRRAAKMAKTMTPLNFNIALRDNPEIPREVFMELAV